MSLLSLLRSVYNVDTLDTRFTTSSSTPYKTVIDSRNDPRAQKEQSTKYADRTQPSKWRTPEFIAYFLILSWVIPYMFWIAYDVSRPSDPHYKKYEPLLKPGWVPGRKIDGSDSQYNSFRKNLPYLAFLLMVHPLLRRAWNAVVYPLGSRAKLARPTLEEADQRLNQRASFDSTFAVIYLVALHGFSALKVMAILYTNYQLVTSLPRKYVPAATWIFNISVLFANELGRGYMFHDIAKLITGEPTVSFSSPEPFLISWGKWMDGCGGLMSRWHVLFNITILRLVSFNLDYYWSRDRAAYSPIEKKQLDPANLSERDRVSIPAQPKDFTFRNYLAYAIYAPLYLTGPIITFNDYISQLRYRPASIETARTIKYGVRFLLCLLAMELVMHFDYVNAITKANPIWSDYTPAQLSLLSYFNLHIIWLKLLLPWRLFRLWSLIDGIDPPENMLRCVSDNYSALSFWRSWHRSFNRWLIRYIYVPLGGVSFGSTYGAIRSLVTYVLVFTFVALWHDIQLRLLIWGWLIVLFLIPEISAGYLFPRRKWADRPTAYRLLCGVGAVGNILMMMMANLVGFAVGLDGLQNILSGILRDGWGVAFLVTACTVLFIGVQVMFEVRENELRRGVLIR